MELQVVIVLCLVIPLVAQHTTNTPPPPQGHQNKQQDKHKNSVESNPERTIPKHGEVKEDINDKDIQVEPIPLPPLERSPGEVKQNENSLDSNKLKNSDKTKTNQVDNVEVNQQNTKGETSDNQPDDSQTQVSSEPPYQESIQQEETRPDEQDKDVDVLQKTVVENSEEKPQSKGDAAEDDFDRMRDQDHQVQEDVFNEQQEQPNDNQDNTVVGDDLPDEAFSEDSDTEYEGENDEDAQTDEEEEDEDDQLTEEEKQAENLYKQGQLTLAKHGKMTSEAMTYFQGAAALNHTKSLEHIAFGYLLGDGLKQNLEYAKIHFEQLAKRGSSRGQMGLGFLYTTGIAVNSSQAKSLVYFTFAALGGDPWAHMVLGYRYWAGVGVEANCETALAHYRKVAMKVAEGVSVTGGNVVQRIRLFDEQENSGSQNGMIDDDLIQYYQFLADKGDMQAQVGLGQLYYQGGRGVEINHERAYNYFVHAAEAGSSNAIVTFNGN